VRQPAGQRRGQKNAWEDSLVKDVVGHVDSHYRTIAPASVLALSSDLTLPPGAI
jgi:hypothetical protein